MSYRYTGYARRKTLTITRDGDADREFLLTDAFTDPTTATAFAAISDRELALLDDTDYYTRRDAFINYVYAQVQGLQADCPDLTQGSVDYDPVSCPLNVVIDQSSIVPNQQ